MEKGIPNGTQGFTSLTYLKKSFKKVQTYPLV